MFTGDEFLRELDFPDMIPILPIPYSKERVCQPPPNYQPPKYLMSNNVFRDYVKEVLTCKGALSTAKLQIIDLSNGNWLTLLCFRHPFVANMLLPNSSIPKHAKRNSLDKTYRQSPRIIHGRTDVLQIPFRSSSGHLGISRHGILHNLSLINGLLKNNRSSKYCPAKGRSLLPIPRIRDSFTKHNDTNRHRCPGTLDASST